MKPLIFIGAAVLAALCFYLFAPLNFLHSSSTLASMIYAVLILIPTYFAAASIFKNAEEGSATKTYGIGGSCLAAVVLSIATFGQIKDSKTDAAITKNGAKTIAILKDGHKETKKSRKGSTTTCEVTLEYTANGKAIETKTNMLESDYDHLEGIGQPLPIVYVKDMPDVVLVMMSEPNKSKYATVPMDVQLETAPPAGN